MVAKITQQTSQRKDTRAESWGTFSVHRGDLARRAEEEPWRGRESDDEAMRGGGAGTTVWGRLALGPRPSEVRLLAILAQH